MAQVRGRKGYGNIVIGMLFAEPTEVDIVAQNLTETIARQIENLAAKRGILISRIYHRIEGLEGTRLDQILLARGIRGVILMPTRPEWRQHPELDWKRYSIAAAGNRPEYVERFHNVFFKHIRSSIVSRQNFSA